MDVLKEYFSIYGEMSFTFVFILFFSVNHIFTVEYNWIFIFRS